MKTIAIFINSLRQFLVDIKIHIFVFLVAPLLIALMYGSIYKNILDPNRTLTKFTVAYIDLDKSTMSKPLENIFTEEKLKKVVNLKTLSSKNNINNSLIDGTYSSAIVIPADFSKNIRNGKPVSIEVLKSPSAGVNGDIVYDIVNAYCSYLNTNTKVYSVILNNTKNPDLTQKIFNAVLPVINSDLNRSYLTITPLAKAKILDSSQEFASNMLIMFSIFMALTQGISILIEREHGTLNRIYSTATNRLSFYFGKLLATFTISIIQIFCFITVSSIFIGVNYGSLYSMIPIVLIHALLITSITAILISLFKNTTVMGGVFAFIILLMTSISGGFYPSQNFSGFMRIASHFTINYWLKNLYSSNMMGNSFLSIGNILITILILSFVIISLGAAKYKYTD